MNSGQFSTFDPSFGHNLCFKCPNGSCKPISDIYVSKYFQWCKELFNQLSFGPWNCPLKIGMSMETPSPKMGVPLGIWGFIPSHFPILPGACSVTPMLPLGPQPCKPLCLGREPKTRVATMHVYYMMHNKRMKFQQTLRNWNKNSILSIMQF
jgi:hypothetical protein